MNRTYLIVFHGSWKDGRIMDVGNDPCFDGLPSWGICRPPTRKYLRGGDTLIFMGCIDKGKEYILKGWFEVADKKLDYVTALKRYPKRLNVIISRTEKDRQTTWRYPKLKVEYQKLYGETAPTFLQQLRTDKEIFFQNPDDDHATDEWKCRRIYHCRSSQFKKCIAENRCFKDGESLDTPLYSNYVVAKEGKYGELDHLRITIEELKQFTGWAGEIRTPKSQHNVIRFDRYKDMLFGLIQARSISTKT